VKNYSEVKLFRLLKFPLCNAQANICELCRSGSEQEMFSGAEDGKKKRKM
jgi:hypothetical protein